MDSLPLLSWAMCARHCTAREIRATKGQLLLQLLGLFWDTAWWFMLANWFNSWADKQLFFLSLCAQMLKWLWKYPLKNTRLPCHSEKGAGLVHNNGDISQYMVMQLDSNHSFDNHRADKTCTFLYSRLTLLRGALCFAGVYISAAIFTR